MNNTQSVKDVEQQLSGPGSDALVKSIGIPPRPAVLMELQKELEKDDPDLRTVARLVAGDVALTASMLRDLQSGLRTEHEHVLGELLRRAQQHGVDAPVLAAAHCHLQVVGR